MVIATSNMQMDVKVRLCACMRLGLKIQVRATLTVIHIQSMVVVMALIKVRTCLNGANVRSMESCVKEHVCEMLRLVDECDVERVLIVI